MEERHALSKSQARALRLIKEKYDYALVTEMNAALLDIADELGLSEDVRSEKIGIKVASDLSAIIIIKPDVAPAKEVEP